MLPAICSVGRIGPSLPESSNADNGREDNRGNGRSEACRQKYPTGKTAPCSYSCLQFYILNFQTLTLVSPSHDLD